MNTTPRTLKLPLMRLPLSVPVGGPDGAVGAAPPSLHATRHAESPSAITMPCLVTSVPDDQRRLEWDSGPPKRRRTRRSERIAIADPHVVNADTPDRRVHDDAVAGGIGRPLVT